MKTCFSCPACGNDDTEELEWIDDVTIRCLCGFKYIPDENDWIRSVGFRHGNSGMQYAPPKRCKGNPELLKAYDSAFGAGRNGVSE